MRLQMPIFCVCGRIYFCYLRSLVIFFTIYTLGKEDVYPLLKYNLSLFDAIFVMVCLYGSR